MIRLIPAGNPGPYTGPAGNNTWLVDGASPLLVDAGVGNDEHIEALKRALDGRELAAVFITHAHKDHSSGAPRLRREFPLVRIVGGPDGERGDPHAWLTAGDSRLQIIPTPGHSADHTCLWDPDARVLFAGDLLVAGGTVMIAGSSGGNLSAYLESLARVRALGPALVYPGHGPIIDAPLTLIDQYVAHRLERERQIVAALERAPSSIESLVASIYSDLAPGLKGAASETVLAHLKKLEEEGRAAERNGIWSI